MTPINFIGLDFLARLWLISGRVNNETYQFTQDSASPILTLEGIHHFDYETLKRNPLL